jgi:hypothetical protein
MSVTERAARAERLKQARIKAGFVSPRAAARHFRWNENTYKSRENGLRDFKVEEAKDYARAYNVAWEWIMAGEGAPPENPENASELLPVRSRLVPVPQVGIVEAGTFREVLEYDDIEPPTFFEEEDPDFPNARQVSFLVAGDSMNAAEPPILPGCRIVCVDFDDAGIPLENGMTVVVERTKDGGQYRELTVKEVELSDDNVTYWPRSTNKRHQPIVVPISDDNEDGIGVNVIALVRRISFEVPRSRRKPR